MSIPLAQIAFVVLTLAIILYSLAVAGLLARRPLRPFVRWLLITMVVVEVIAAILHMMRHGGAFGDGALAWFFNLRYERNLGAIFSSLQLTLVSLITFSVAVFAPRMKAWKRAYWLLATAVFFFFSLDEFYSIHEYFGGRGPSDAYQVPYAIGAIVFFTLSGLTYWFGFRRRLLVFVLILTGLTVTITSAVAIEELTDIGFVKPNATLDWMVVFEEIGEMVGATIALAGALLLAQDTLRRRGWKAMKVVAGVGSVLWSFWMIFALYFQPAVELQLLGFPVPVDYGEISLVGYDVVPEVIEPGGEAEITLYWRADEPLTTDYSVSTHALSHPDIDSVAQADDLHVGPIPSHSWVPGVVMKRTLYVRLPRNLPTPASYWLGVRIWSGPWPLGRPWEDTTGLPVVESKDLRVLGDDMVIVGSIPAIDDAPIPEPPTEAAWRFPDQGITLAGYDLTHDPVDIHELPVSFWWTTNARPGRDLTQFFHLVPQDDGELFTFDQQPFGGSFPTIDWPTNMRVMDKWTLMLPDDMAAGTYDVYTGLYDVTTMERMNVTDASGTALQDNAIHLGSIEFAPSEEAEVALAAARAREAADVCYALSDTNERTGSEADTLVIVNMTTGVAVEIGETGTIKTEGMTFNADRTALYMADERDVAQFGIIEDLTTGRFRPIGNGLVTHDALARNPALYDAFLKDIDSMALEPATGIVWGVHQDEENLLFQVNTETGEVVRDAFGEGYDYLKIDISGLPGSPNNVKDMAVDPNTGIFYILPGTEEFDSLLATLDFDGINLETGMIPAVLAAIPTDARDGTPILDIEGMSFTPDGILYVTSTNNSNTEAYYDVLWQLNTQTGEATYITKLSDYVDAVDYEALACNSSASLNP